MILVETCWCVNCLAFVLEGSENLLVGTVRIWGKNWAWMKWCFWVVFPTTRKAGCPCMPVQTSSNIWVIRARHSRVFNLFLVFRRILGYRIPPIRVLDTHIFPAIIIVKGAARTFKLCLIRSHNQIPVHFTCFIFIIFHIRAWVIRFTVVSHSKDVYRSSVGSFCSVDILFARGGFRRKMVIWQVIRGVLIILRDVILL